MGPSCHWLLPLHPGAASDSWQPDQQSRRRDGSDARHPDGGRGDGKLPDLKHAPDGKLPDLKHAPDGKLADLKQGPDGKLLDLKGVADGLPNQACSAPAVPVWGAPTIAICQNLNGSYTQCQAGNLCSASWHLCTASEYLVRASLASCPTTGNPAWIRGCMLASANKYTDLSDLLCSCAGGFGSYRPAGSTCTSPSTSYPKNELELAPASASVCNRMPWASGGSAEGCWYHYSPDTPFKAAVCCK